jgi:hypothetical protein
MDGEGETPMSRVLRSGDRALLDFVIRHEQTPVEEDSGKSHLQRAAYWGLENAVRVLVDSGGDVDERDPDGETALHKAVREGHIDVVRALIEQGANVNALNSWGMAPLHWTALNGREDIAELLIEHGADLNLRDTYVGNMTPLAVALLMGYEHLAETMHIHGGAT